MTVDHLFFWIKHLLLSQVSPFLEKSFITCFIRIYLLIFHYTDCMIILLIHKTICSLILIIIETPDILNSQSSIAHRFLCCHLIKINFTIFDLAFNWLVNHPKSEFWFKYHTFYTIKLFPKSILNPILPSLV